MQHNVCYASPAPAVVAGFIDDLGDAAIARPVPSSEAALAQLQAEATEAWRRLLALDGNASHEESDRLADETQRLRALLVAAMGEEAYKTWHLATIDALLASDTDEGLTDEHECQVCQGRGLGPDDQNCAICKGYGLLPPPPRGRTRCSTVLFRRGVGRARRFREVR